MKKLLPLLALVGCKGNDNGLPPVPHTTALVKLEHSSQQDLARELDVADRRGSWTELRRRWQGQSLTWTVTRYRQLCNSAEACNIAPFEIRRPAAYGWMPLLGFSAGEYDKLAKGCGDREQCKFTFEGTLLDLDAGGESATKLRFSNVRVVSTS